MDNINAPELDVAATEATQTEVPLTPQMADPNTLPDVIFYLQDEKYSISSQYVLHIGVLPKITPMTGLEHYCRGIVLFNNESVPVYDLRKVFGIASFDQELEALMQQRIADHQRWVNELENSVNNNTEFTLTTDPHQCAFGKWYDSFKTDNYYLSMYMKQIEAPHAAIHKTGERVKQLMRDGKVDEAKKAIDDMKRKYYTKTLEILRGMGQVYREGRREMLIILHVRGNYLSIVADSISSIKKLTETSELPPDTDTSKNGYIEMLAKDGSGSNADVIQMINPFALK